MKHFAAVLSAVAGLCVAGSASAEGSRGSGGATGTRVGWPCPGCVTVVPPGYSPDTPVPLFVTLHGDEGSTRVVLKLWKGPVEKRGFILLALLCPKDKGCSGSYWRWGGDPSFMIPSLDAVEAAYNVDRARVYLSGWSGGSTYMGMSAPQISPRFAALNLNAGGIPPERTADCAPCKAPVYYFMGGRNPYAHLAETARDYYKRCGHDVVWDLGKDLDHPGELMTLSKATTQERILAWFDTKRSTCAEPPGDAGADASPPAATPMPVELSANTGDSGPPAPPPGEPNSSSSILGESPSRQGAASQPGCGCRGPSSPSAASPAGALYLIALTARLRGLASRRRRRGRAAGESSPGRA